MEKVWEELKKIETQAEQIHVEAQSQSKQITKLAQQDAAMLLFNSKKYAEQEAQQIIEKVTEEANRKHEEQLEANLEVTEKLKGYALRRMEQAANKIVDAVLGDKASVADQKIR